MLNVMTYYIFLLQNTSSVTVSETLLFVSTLDGSLHAVSKRTGAIKWTLKEGEQEMSSCLYSVTVTTVKSIDNSNSCRAW